MGAKAAAQWPASRRIFARADEVLGFPLSQICHSGPADALTRTENAQAAIYTTSIAVVEGLAEAGRFDAARFSACAGLSLGEYTALWFAGVFSFEEGLLLVRKRGLAMQAAADAVPSGMTSLVGADEATAQRVCERAREDGTLVVANINAPGQIVLSGDKAALARVPAAATAEGVRRAIPLVVAGAFHSPLMQPACEALDGALTATQFSAARIPVYSNVTGCGTQDAETLREQLRRQIVAPVLWHRTMENFGAAGFRLFAEPPPGKVLSALARKILSDVECQSLSEEE